MHPSDSDAVLSLAASYENSFLCLLEQIMPDFPEPSAYVDTMMEHFDKRVRTPLRGTRAAPTLQDKDKALRRQGWETIEMVTLKEFWYQKENKGTRTRAFRVETFDEWYVVCREVLGWFFSMF
jgi:hypothetical protein